MPLLSFFFLCKECIKQCKREPEGHKGARGHHLFQSYFFGINRSHHAMRMGRQERDAFVEGSKQGSKEA
jgi:hypothetical protein